MNRAGGGTSWTLTGKGSFSVKANETKSMTPKLLTAGEYFISVASSNAKTGGDAYYNLSVGEKTVFFDSADDGANNVLYVKKSRTFVDDSHFVSTELSGGSQSVQLDTNAMGNADYENFVGYGDAVDYAKIVLMPSRTSLLSIVPSRSTGANSLEPVAPSMSALSC